MFKNIDKKLSSPCDIVNLGVFRILFGAVLSAQFLLIFTPQFISINYTQAKFHLHHWIFEALKLPIIPDSLMFWLFFSLTIVSMMIMLGFFTRFALFVFVINFSYVFLFEKGIYNNHYYAMILIAFLLLFTDSAKYLSLDSIRKTDQLHTVPYWQYFLLRSQIVIIYFFGAIVKINTDWMLHAEPLFTRFSVDGILFNTNITNAIPAYLFSYGGFAYDLILALALLFNRYIKTAFFLVITFNVTNFFLFGAEIGVFPFFMIGAFSLFIKPEFLRKILKRNPLPSIKTTSNLTTHKTVIAFVIAYLIIQITLPLRHYIYPGKVSWNGKGYLFSWRMKLDLKNVNLKIFITDPDTQHTFEYKNFKNDFTELQSIRGGDPQNIYQYIQFLKKELVKLGIKNPIIHIDGQAALNGRPYLPYIDKNIDIASIKPSPFAYKKYVLPLDEKY